MNASPPPRFGAHVGMGKSVRRKEDAAFVTGRGQYTDDVRCPDALHSVFLRSPYGHATFSIGDLEEVRAMPGVQLVLTGADMAPYKPLSVINTVVQRDGSKPVPRDIPLLCEGVARHVGDALAFVVAETVAQAREAAEAIPVDYDMMPAVVDTMGALADDAPLLYPEAGTNLAFDAELGNVERAEEIFATAPRVSELTLVNNRLVCNFMEVRACLAEWSDADDRFTLTVGSQGAHSMRDRVARCLNVEPAQLRVITPDVGGGFGTKVFPYREYPVALIAAKMLGRPVRWLADRSEHFVADAHGRDNVTTMRMAMDDEGRFLALDVDLTAAMGAYLHAYAPYIPMLGTTIATGVYAIEACAYRFRGVYSNTTPTDAYRGAGRPEAIYALERLVDQCARDMNLAPQEIRRRNFIQPQQMPYTTPFGRMYDTGEFEAHMDLCMKRADWAGFDTRAQESERAGRHRGIGMATYIEACAFAGSEPAKLDLNADGTITLHIGTQSNGQGHKTAYAQFAAEVLNVDIDAVDVKQGDTDDLPSGGGTGGSRSIPLGGVSVHYGSEQLARRMKDIAAEEMEVAADDLELHAGSVRIIGTDRSMTFSDIATAAAATTGEALTATGTFKQAEATYPNGTHICEVEIEPATGEIEITRYTIVDDYGATVNPLLLEGQVHGGVAQAIGQCIMERTVYDDDGQLITASFMDYRMPRAQDIPHFSFETRNVPSTTNALGMKGAGEAGTIGGCPAVMNAIVNALHRARGIEHIDMPVTPLALWERLQTKPEAA